MADAVTPKFKIFISWSKSPSRQVAHLVKEWLEDCFDNVVAWESDVDLLPGTRSMSELHAQLRGSDAGILLITTANQGSPWVNYEAGVLAQEVSDRVNLVVPLLIDTQNLNDISGPLANFQGAAFTQEGMRKVLRSLGRAQGMDQGRLDRRFDAYWPSLEKRFSLIMQDAVIPDAAIRPKTEGEKLDELLTRMKSLERRWSSSPPAPLGARQLTSEGTTAQPGVVKVTLSDFGKEPIFIEVGRRTLVQQFLDEVWTTIRESVDPYRYGSQWVLTTGHDGVFESHGTDDRRLMLGLFSRLPEELRAIRLENSPGSL